MSQFLFCDLVRAFPRHASLSSFTVSSCLLFEMTSSSSDFTTGFDVCKDSASLLDLFTAFSTISFVLNTWGIRKMGYESNLSSLLKVNYKIKPHDSHNLKNEHFGQKETYSVAAVKCPSLDLAIASNEFLLVSC